MSTEPDEHEILSEIFKDALAKINNAKTDNKLPHIRTSVLPYIMNLAEDVLLPVMDKTDENYSHQLFAISAGFGWTIKQFMPFETFLANMNSSQMRLAHNVLADMLGRKDGVTRGDVDDAFDKEARKHMPGIG